MLHLTGWLQQHAPPQQLGQNFRPSRSEDGGHRWNGDFTVAWIRQQIAQKRHAAALTLHRSSSWEPCQRRRVATSGGRKRTHHRQNWLCCVCWTHTCQQKLVLPRLKEIRKWCSRDFPHLTEVYFCYLRGLFCLVAGGKAREGNPASAPNYQRLLSGTRQTQEIRPGKKSFWKGEVSRRWRFPRVWRRDF